MATAPAAMTTVLGGRVLTSSSTAVGVGAAAGAGVVGGIASRTIENTGDPNKSLGTPEQIGTDAAVGAVSQAAGSAIGPIVKRATTAGKVVQLNEARAARGTKTPHSFETRKAELQEQQTSASGVAGIAADTSARARQQRSEPARQEAERRKSGQ